MTTEEKVFPVGHLDEHVASPCCYTAPRPTPYGLIPQHQKWCVRHHPWACPNCLADEMRRRSS